MLTIYLIRHGQTAWNADNNRYCGRTDIPLTEKGVKQAERLREQLQSVQFDGVFSSPLQRAKATAELATGREVITDERLIEADFGLWENKTREEFISENISSWKDWSSDPATARAGVTGETGLEVVQRVDNFFNDLLAKHSSGTFLVAAHNGVNRLYMAYKLGMPLKNYRRLVQENSTITIFTLGSEEEFMLHFLNLTLK